MFALPGQDDLLLVVKRVNALSAFLDSDDGRNLLGVFTDGDLRRLIDRVSDLRSITVDSVMSRTPRSIGAQALAVEGVALMEKHRINQLPVVDADNRVVGALNMHDLFAAGVV